MNKSNEWGKQAEKIAEDYLVRQGMPIRERNWHAGNHMEVDLISQEGDSIVFIEVKARSHHDEDPAEAIDEKKIRRLVRAADVYLRQREHLWAYRFDIILITGNPDDYKIEHIREAFMPPLNMVF